MSFKYSVEEVLCFLENCNISIRREDEKVVSIFTIPTQHIEVNNNFIEVIEQCMEAYKEYGNVSPLRKMINELENTTDNIPLTLAEIDKLSNINTEDMMNNFIILGEQMYNGIGISEKYFSENGNASSLVNQNNF